MTVKEYLSSLKYMDMRIKVMSAYPDEQKRLQKWYNLNLDRINGIHNRKYADLLEYRYVKCLKWNEITEKLGEKSDAYVRRVIHKRALEAFAAKYPDYIKDYPFKI